MDDVTDYPEITAALLQRGYSKKDIRKILGGNVLRVVRENMD
jgi:membrane dipeptidase